MKSNTYDIKRDLYTLTTMSLSLEQYISDPNIFHNPQGMFSKMPPMTLGTFLLRLRRISALQKQLDIGERAQLTVAIQAHQNVVEDWTHHYDSKLQEEVELRINSTQAFLNELEESPDSIDFYHPELYTRTVIEELLNQTNHTSQVPPKLFKKLEIVDEKWRSITQESYFHWDERLREVYPADHYWWLYREPTVERILK